MATAADLSVVIGPAVTVIGWLLLHAVWQVAVLGAWTAATLAALRGCSPRVRYLVAVVGLLAMPAWPLATVVAQRTAPLEDWAWLAAPDAARAFIAWAAPGLAAWRPVVVVAWLSGVGLLSWRLVCGWRTLRRLVHDEVLDVPRALQARVASIAARMGITRMVRLGRTLSTEVPCVVGWLRPMILMPASVLGGLAPVQLEAILAHELAHIRRHDALMNLVQLGVETLLYFHPVMWWLSRRVRVEREHCCDDLALAICTDRVAYARALTDLERLRGEMWRPAMAASGGDLLSRVRHVVTGHSTTRPWPHLASALAAVSGVGLLTLAAALTTAAGGIPAVPSLHLGSTAASPVLLVGALLGLTVGLRHALEPDHVVTVATMVTAERSAADAARLGATWGVGHAASLGIVAALSMGVRANMPGPLASTFETAVAVMLIALGARAIQRGIAAAHGGPLVEHAHGRTRHTHATAAAHVHIGPFAVARRPLLVGVIHGLAGSGSLTALAAANLPTALAQATFLAVFALGSTLAMAALSGCAGWPLARLARAPRFVAALSMASGAVSVVLGVAWGYPRLLTWL